MLVIWTRECLQGAPISLQLIGWLVECCVDGQHVEVVAVTTPLMLQNKNNWFFSWRSLLRARRSHDGFVPLCNVFLFIFCRQGCFDTVRSNSFHWRCDYEALCQNDTRKMWVCSTGAKKKKKAFSILFEAFMKYECFYFYFYLSISYPAYKMWGSVPISALACFYFC